jgi:hypothetical protein
MKHILLALLYAHAQSTPVTTIAGGTAVQSTTVCKVAVYSLHTIATTKHAKQHCLCAYAWRVQAMSRSTAYSNSEVHTIVVNV